MKLNEAFRLISGSLFNRIENITIRKVTVSSFGHNKLGIRNISQMRIICNNLRMIIQ